MGARGHPKDVRRGIFTSLLALLGASLIAVLVHLFFRTPRALATPTRLVADVDFPRPAAVRRRSRRRLWATVRTLTFFAVCGALAVVPFALEAYADAPVPPAIEVPTEELEPLPPSYEQAGLAENAPIATAEIVADSSAFRSSDRDLRSVVRTRGRRYVLPVDKSLVTLEQLGAKHHDYPAADVALEKGTEIYAAHRGEIETVTTRGRCGRGVVVAGADGYSYVYCHGSEVLVEDGQKVKTGELIMLSGNSGRSTGPHLHFGIENGDGDKVCPQGLLKSWYEGGEDSPDTAKSKGCFDRTSKKGRKGKARKDGPVAGAVDRSSGAQGDTDDDRDPTPIPRPRPTPKPRLPAPTPSPDPTPDPTPDATPTVTAEVEVSATP